MNIIGFNDIISDRRRSCRQRDVCGDLVNFEDLTAQSSYILIEVWFAYICSECMCIMRSELYCAIKKTQSTAHYHSGNFAQSSSLEAARAREDHQRLSEWLWG